MIRLSRKSNLHPQCLTIRDVEKLGNYPVGGGAFGDVWKGKIGQQLVCLKVIRAFEDSDVKKTAKDYMQEAIIWRQMNHRKLLPFLGIYYLDTEQQQLCLVSPWMERGNLVQYLKKTPPELVDHESLAYDVASGLSHLHEANIVHGDLKGENVLIAPDLRACIGDFGLSRVSTTQTLLTETTRAKGTTRWLSPELLRPGPNCVNSKQSDVYAYACVCYEIFTGRYPFYELPNEGAVLCAILFEKQRPSRPDSCAKLQDSMWSMMAACWDELPPSRPTMADVLNRIHGMNADLKPLSAWEDSAFTQIWSDASMSIQHLDRSLQVILKGRTVAVATDLLVRLQEDLERL
ncbi:kinase-like protein [Marasmius fiardii PR-910]|nr:kinase-like protein [Marasmius fiardii PR-910]